MSKFWWGCAIFLAALFAAAVTYMFAGERPPDMRTHLLVRQDPTDKQTVIFSWSGSVDPPMAQEFSREFNRLENTTKRIVVELDSLGGSVDEGERVIMLLRKFSKTHAVWTFVGDGKNCLSMCVPIYLQGRMRVASPNSTWLFHYARSVDAHTGAEIIMYSNERSRAKQEFFCRYIDRSDVNPKWRDRLMLEMQNGDVWKSGQELKDERSNIVTVLE